MSSKILVCDNLPTTHERMVELVRSFGPETQMLVIDDVDNHMGVLAEAHDVESVLRSFKEKAPSKSILLICGAALMRSVERPRPINIGVIGHRHSLAALACSIGALSSREVLVVDTPPPPLEFLIEAPVKMMTLCDGEFFFEKEKPNWPKPNHVRPTAQRKNPQRRNFHPARSR